LIHAVLSVNLNSQQKPVRLEAPGRCTGQIPPNISTHAKGSPACKKAETLAQQFPALSLLIELPGPFNCRLGMRELLVVDNGHNAGPLADVGGVFDANPE
jgi:hypothetical protein